MANLKHNYIIIVFMALLSAQTYSQWDPMSVWAIIKINYNNDSNNPVKDTTLLIGSAFFIDSTTFITARHCLSRYSYFPHPGYKYCKYILASANGKVIENFKVEKEKSEYDITIGEVYDSIQGIRPWRLSDSIFVGDDVYGLGYPVKETYNRSIIRLRMINHKLIIDSLKLYISSKSCKIIKDTIVSDVIQGFKIKDVSVYTLDCFMQWGYSGCPIINPYSNNVVGFTSYGTYDTTIYDKRQLDTDYFPGIQNIISSKAILQFMK